MTVSKATGTRSRLAESAVDGGGLWLAPATRGRMWRSWRLPSLQKVGPLTALIGVTTVFALLNPNLLGAYDLRAIAAEASILLIAAIGETFIILLGSIDLSVEGVMATSSMTMALLVANDRTGLSLGILGILITLVIGALFGLLNGVAHTKLKIPSLMVTLGTWFVGLGIATVLFNGQTPVIKSPLIASLTIPDIFGLPRFVFVAIVVALLGAFVLGSTRFGRRILAIGADERIVREMGIAVDAYKIGAFCVASAMYSLAGVLQTAQLGNGSVEVGSGMVFTTIAAVVAGGTLLTGGSGGVGRSVIGVLLLTVIDKGMVLSGVTPYVQPAVQGVIVVFAVTLGSWSLRERLRVIK